MSSWIAHLSLVGVALCATVRPAMAEERPVATHPCARVVSPQDRLACYDRAFPPVHDARAEAREQARTFGLPPRSTDVAREAPVPRAAHLAVHVVSVGADRDGERTFVLDNGQVWKQTRSSVLGLVHPGDAVTLRAASFGSYLLVTAGGVPLRVKRVR